MTLRPIAFSLVVCTLTAAAAPVWAAASPVKMSRQETRQAKAEVNLFVEQHPPASKLAQSMRTPINVGLRGGGVVVALASLRYSAMGLLGYAFTAGSSTSALQLFWGGLGGAAVATWGGFKLARMHNRAVNTDIVRHAIDAGATVSNDRLQRWRQAGSINALTKE